MMKARIGGYQGPHSVHTRGMKALSSMLLELDTRFDVEEHLDVTREGMAARDLFEGLETGAFDIGYLASGYMTERVPELGLMDIPFLVSDRRKACAALDSEAGDILRSAFERKTGMKLLGFWDNGLRHITNRKRSVRCAADCEGLVIRTLDNRFYQETLRSMGFTPVVTDVKDLVTAVETGKVDAQENPLTNLVRFGMHRFHHHVSETGHIFGVALCVVNAQYFAALDETARDALVASARYATLIQREIAEREDQETRAILQRERIEIVPRENIDIGEFLRLTAKVRTRITSRLSPNLVEGFAEAVI